MRFHLRLPSTETPHKKGDKGTSKPKGKSEHLLKLITEQIAQDDKQTHPNHRAGSIEQEKTPYIQADGSRQRRCGHIQAGNELSHNK